MEIRKLTNIFIIVLGISVFLSSSVFAGYFSIGGGGGGEADAANLSFEFGSAKKYLVGLGFTYIFDSCQRQYESLYSSTV